MTDTQQTWQERFDALDIHVSPERCLADREMVEKMKLVLPVAWQLFKPDVKQFISKEITLAVEEYKKRVRDIPELQDEKDHFPFNDYLESCAVARNSLREKILSNPILQLPEAPNTLSK